MAITYRLVKGTPLTFIQTDDNFRWLTYNLSGSYIKITGSFSITQSNLILTDLGDTSSQTIQGSLTLTGDLTAEEYIISSSVVHYTESFASGSTRWGDSADDTHRITGSVLIKGDTTQVGGTTQTGDIAQTGKTRTGIGYGSAGDYSHIEGYYSKTTSARGAHAEGYRVTASGDFSHAEGFGTKTTGHSSHAEGYFTIAGNSAGDTGSHAEGHYTEVRGKGGHSEGYKTTASGEYAHAEGWSTRAGDGSSDYAAHSEGRFTRATKIGAHSEGYKTTASGEYSHAEGETTLASGNYSHAEGYRTKATANIAHSEGYITTASGGFGAHAEGSLTLAIGDESHAEGKNSKSEGVQSHAEGHATTSSGAYSHTQGWKTTTSAAGDAGFASGVYSKVKHSGSFSHGYMVTSSNVYQTTIGKWNGGCGKGENSTTNSPWINTTSTYTASFVVGTGLNDTKRTMGFAVGFSGSASSTKYPFILLPAFSSAGKAFAPAKMKGSTSDGLVGGMCFWDDDAKKLWIFCSGSNDWLTTSTFS